MKQLLLAAVFAVGCSTACAREPLLVPTFTEEQKQVLVLAARDPGLMESVASLLGTNEIRLQGQGEGRLMYNIAQYLTYLESKRSDWSPEAKQFARDRLKDPDWAFSVLGPFVEEARSKNRDLCDVRIDSIPCYYFILSKDMQTRVKVLEDLGEAK